MPGRQPTVPYTVSFTTYHLHVAIYNNDTRDDILYIKKGCTYKNMSKRHNISYTSM